MAPPFLISSLDVNEWSVSHLCCFIPMDTVPYTHSTGGWVRRCSELYGEEKNFLLLLGIEPHSSSP
jgi:hypothetical protein